MTLKRLCNSRASGFSRHFNRTKEATVQCRKTSVANTRYRRQDLIGREGYTKGASEQGVRTMPENVHRKNARRCRQWCGSVTSLYTVTNRDGQCRKTSIVNTRSGRQDFIGRPRSIFNIFVLVLATQQWKRSPTDGITIAILNRVNI